jgi:hypothetical protein
MSNRRRKSIGTAKLKRNRTMRVIRGALKAGAPLPGDGAAFRAPEGWTIDGRLEAQGKALRDEVGELYESGRLSRVKVAG